MCLVFFFRLKPFFSVIFPLLHFNSSVISRRLLRGRWLPSSPPWHYAPLSWSNVAYRPCMKWRHLARYQADRGGQWDKNETLEWAENTVDTLNNALAFLVWLQHSVDSSEDGVKGRRSPGILPRTDLHLCEGDTGLLLLFWGLRAQPFYVCTVHGHGQRIHRYAIEFSTLKIQSVILIWIEGSLQHPKISTHKWSLLSPSNCSIMYVNMLQI